MNYLRGKTILLNSKIHFFLLYKVLELRNLVSTFSWVRAFRGWFSLSVTKILKIFSNYL